ncbi:Transposable element P transposase [Frankliniella fusca]|uniref:Transposable element P transposase n=1 Tax=Frankliniella fusca TaxID=407009 RepID=A0AAE1GR64_9NEOP|nr:Transposable element P transposase [Frankliniella fusca]
MVFHACVVPGCLTRRGDGFAYKCLPTNDENLFPQWLEFLAFVGLKTEPQILAANSSAVAVCEKHFEPRHFNKPRPDGRKRLKITAVPTMGNPTKSKTNKTSSPQKSDSVSDYHDGDTFNINEMIDSSPMVGGTFDSSLLGDEVFHSTLISSEFEVTDTDCLEMECSGQQHTSTMILDESSGLFVSSSDPSETMEDSNVENCTDTNSTFISSILQQLEESRAEIENLKSQNSEKDARIMELQELSSGKFVLKFEALRKRMARMEESVKRNAQHSPYLSESQLKRLFRKTNRGQKWNSEEIREGLILKMKCGTTGYNSFVTKYPILPKARTLQESVQFIRFDSGLLYEIFDLIEGMSQGMTELEKDCQVVLDEMALDGSPKYDHALKKWVGNCTLSTHSGVATKALLVILAGISVRWKIAVAVEFTGKANEEAREKTKKNLNPTGQVYHTLVDSVVVKAESAGLKVCGLTTDMGADNLALWKSIGVTGGKGKNVKSSYPNPVRPASEIFVMPDSVHAMKAVKGMLESNKTVLLPDDIVQREALPTAVVDYRHIEDLLEYEEGFELKVAFRLRKDAVHCKKQFKTMNVGTTKAVICHRTGVALKLLASEKEDRSYETTAWFVMYMNSFFTLATCRNRGLAISKHNMKAYENAIHMIKTVSHMFSHMKVGKPGAYKPVQRGIIILCNSYLGLIKYFLDERNYSYLMLGRFTSDCIENMFSLIRLTQPIPNASSFLQCLKVVTLAQFSEAVKGSSYDFEESSRISSRDILEEARQRAKERAMARYNDSLEEMIENPIGEITEDNKSIVDRWERTVLYDMAGSVINAIMRSNMNVCAACVDSVKHKGPHLHPASSVTEMKEFSMLRSSDSPDPLQIYVSDEVFQAFLTAEVTFRQYRERCITFKNTDMKNFFVESLMYVWTGSNTLNCHDICRKMLTVFLDYRLKVFARRTRDAIKETEALQRSSKSVAMRQAADQIMKCRRTISDNIFI